MTPSLLSVTAFRLITAAVSLTVSAMAFAADGDRTEQAGDIRVTLRGEGAPVLMIPGLSSDAAVWDDACAALRQKKPVQCVIVQMPGFSKQVPAEAFRQRFLSSSREQLTAYLQSRFPQGVTVAGHSLGGVIGLELAMQPQSPVKALVVVDSLPFMGALQNPAATAESVRPQAEGMRQMMASNRMPAEALRPQFQGMASGMVMTESRRPEVVQWMLDSDRPTSAQAMYELQTTDLRADVARIKVPVTVLGAWAAYKPMGATLESTRAIYEGQYKALPQVKIRMSEKGFHFLPWDDTSLVVDAMAEAI